MRQEELQRLLIQHLKRRTREAVSKRGLKTARDGAWYAGTVRNVLARVM